MIYTWNKLLRLANPNTHYFAWLSDHDLLSPSWLECLVSTHCRVENAALVYSHTIAIDANGNTLRDYSEFEYSIDSKSCTSRIYALFFNDILMEI